MEHFPFRGPFYLKKKSLREKILHKNHKHGSRPKDFNKNTDTSYNTYPSPTQATISLPFPKVISVRFEYPYDHINPMENTHEDTNLIDTQ